MALMIANIGVPMIALEWPAALLLLLPVILVEAAWMQKRLGLAFGQAFSGALWANLASTLLGIPLSWVAMLAVALLTTGGTAHGMETVGQRVIAVGLQAAWLVPYEEALYWMVPAAMTVLLLPAFLVSVLIERFVYIRKWRQLDRALVAAATWQANALSYVILLVVCLAWLVGSVLNHRT